MGREPIPRGPEHVRGGQTFPVAGDRVRQPFAVIGEDECPLAAARQTAYHIAFRGCRLEPLRLDGLADSLEVGSVAERLEVGFDIGPQVLPSSRPG